MYKLIFLRNSSKYFQEALDFAIELGGTYKNGIVTIEIGNDRILKAYSTMRTLFGIIQNWKGTVAEYNGIPVHPYQFIYQTHKVYECFLERDIDHNCNLPDGSEGWGCKRLGIVNYKDEGRGKHWYNYGHFQGYKWIIDKGRIKEKLLKYARENALDACPFFDETKLLNSVDNLPGFVVPDNVTFEIVYAEKFVDGTRIQYPSNVKLVKKINRSIHKLLS